MEGYIIKVTYLTGPQEGKSYFLQSASRFADNLDAIT